MKLTTKSEYSLLALIYIARNQEQGHVRSEAIASEYSIPRKYLEALLSILKQNRYLKARRGAGGGYILAHPAKEICLAEIIRLMDGALAPTESVSSYFYSETPVAQEEKLLGVFRQIRDYVAGIMEKISIADLVTDKEDQ